MAGMQFEYDEEGGTFYFFLLSFMALVLIPSTYYFWQRKETKDQNKQASSTCLCDPCQMKKQKLKMQQPWQNLKMRLIKITLLISWVLFIMVAYKTSQVKLDFTEFDPFAELGIDRGSSNRQIRKAYHKLSIIYHPDKMETGDSNKFLKITKAYKALTDEEARKNWEEYGNPDGPGATHFGIALPKWIVEKQNSMWVLGLYGLVFMVLLPVAVGTWWYKSIKYSAEQILMDTTQLYFIFFHKTPNMMLKRVLMVLAASFEFEKSHNNEIIERPSDNEQIPPLMKNLPYLNEKNKERPLCYLYSVKARALLHAHLSRLELPPKTLDIDKDYVLMKCPYLINEMCSIVSQLVAMAHAGRVSKMPRLDTVENIMKVHQMMVQALWDNKSALLQLPHLTDDRLRHFTTRKRNIRTIRQLIAMRDDDRRLLLRTLADDEYRDVMTVCGNMPHVDMQIDTQVMDEEDPTITAGSIVTVSVRLRRQNMEVLFNTEGRVEDLPAPGGSGDGGEAAGEAEEEEELEEQVRPESALVKPKVWEKQKKKKGGRTKVNKKKAVKAPLAKKGAVVAAGVGAATGSGGEKEGEKSEAGSLTPNGTPGERSGRVAHRVSTETDSESESESGESEAEIADHIADRIADHNRTPDADDADDDDDWLKFQEESKRENQLETKSKETHLVHCPHFPAEKFEWWWLYVADKKSHLLISAPIQVTSLKNEEEIQLKFSAPSKPGIYNYTVILRSDSYLDFDQSHNVKLDVKEAKRVENHPQWEISDDDDDKADDEDDYGSESDVSDYDESDN